MTGLAGIVLRRVGLGLLTLLFVSLMVFATTQALPGDAARAILGREATPERLAAVRARLHLDRPVWTQYAGWLANVAVGDFGESLATEQPVSDLIGTRIGNSAFLVLVSGLIAVPLSLLLGVAAAVRRDRLLDHAFTAVSLVLAALPEFVIGISLIMLFATQVFHLLPAVAILAEDKPIWMQLDQVILPAITLDLAVIPYMSRIIRGSMIEVMESEYVQMARLKGLSPRRVIWRHALPNAIVPFVQVTALQLAWLAGGVVVVEYVFRYPGIGQALVDAVANRDLPVVQALTLLVGAVYVLLNVIADIATILLTPRLRTAVR
jgi:peptide/nickel transport system permease protein